jgi:hypothetical protein
MSIIIALASTELQQSCNRAATELQQAIKGRGWANNEQNYSSKVQILT